MQSDKFELTISVINLPKMDQDVGDGERERVDSGYVNKRNRENGELRLDFT